MQEGIDPNLEVIYVGALSVDVEPVAQDVRALAKLL